jgi:ATP-dependent exoDNAse (exonuclease V) beta subunit
MTDIAELEATLDAEHVSSHGDARLQVMTMHRAKGLQFDHVLLYGLGRVPRPGEPSVMSWFDLPDEHGQPLKVIAPVGPRAELEKDPVHSFIAGVEAEKDRNELTRLLYVACTRARSSLHLVGSARIYKTGMRPDKRSLLHLLWPAVREEYESLAEDGQHEDDGGDRDAWLVPELRRLEDGWRPPAAPPLPADRPAVDTTTPAVEFYWVGSEARIAGTLVHRWIQLLIDRKLDPEQVTGDSLEAVSGRWLREIGITEAMAGPIIERTAEALQKLADDERGRWLLGGEGHAELALTGVVSGRVESVVLDRVRIDAAGVHWIVDYKTSSHEGGDLAGFLAAETDRYRPQLAKYREIYRNYCGADTRCALYFPLLQEFVEVVP